MMDVDNDKEFFRYKYIPFNEGSLKVITEGTIKFTMALDFNDPYDCLPIVHERRQDTESEIFKTKFNEQSVGLSPAQKIKLKERMKGKFSGSVRSGEYYNTFLKRIGVLSLSRQYDNTLMWSHYADYHKGFLVGFRYSIPEDLVENDADLDYKNIIPRKVIYSSDRPVYDVNSQFKTEVLLNKNEVWKYEEEERAFSWKVQPGIHDYDREKRLHCVVAGAKIKPENLVLLKNSVRQASKEIGRKIILLQAKLSDSSYDLEFHELPLKP
ncbi:DUF2971 domain-containing protein [Aeromonas intestinalis]